MSKELSAAEGYRAQTQEAAIVDVKVPSGFVFKFRQPSKFGLLFSIGSLPTAASDLAAEEWEKQGVFNPVAGLTETESTSIDKVLKLRDKVIALSYDPKIVVGPAKSSNELSTDEIADTDLEYLFKWVAAGGDAGTMLATFPAGRRSGAMASASRKKQRAAA